MDIKVSDRVHALRNMAARIPVEFDMVVAGPWTHDRHGENVLDRRLPGFRSGEPLTPTATQYAGNGRRCAALILDGEDPGGSVTDDDGLPRENPLTGCLRDPTVNSNSRAGISTGHRSTTLQRKHCTAMPSRKCAGAVRGFMSVSRISPPGSRRPVSPNSRYRAASGE